MNEPEINIALAWLRTRIEDMSEMTPQWSKTAYTHRRTLHVAFANGEIKTEGEDIAPAVGRNVRDLAEDTLTAVRAYRALVNGPALLTWRVEPEFTIISDGEKKLYCRLAFETDLNAEPAE